MIFHHAMKSPDKEYEDIVEGYFIVGKIEQGKLWVDEALGERESIGPITVTREISSLCQEGWSIYLVLGEDKGKWYILESGNVYRINEKRVSLEKPSFLRAKNL
ncbi:hypothetical protein [Alteribacter populi]|uniref:hypothetical protein n=1 Tax=Alteribacter populi TaxID=2011011 RepID=UPI000BBACD65|nr:hypothetical protein [Alteribacter populi]